MKSRMTAKGEWLEDGGIEQKGKSTHGHGQQGGDCGAQGGWMEVEEDVTEVNGNGKNTIKIS